MQENERWNAEVREKQEGEDRRPRASMVDDG
jgi:hypothetical protein